MTFKEAYEKMLEGYKIRRLPWKGYWKWENDTIMIYCWNGEILDIRDTKDVKMTIDNMLYDDWCVVY